VRSRCGEHDPLRVRGAHAPCQPRRWAAQRRATQQRSSGRGSTIRPCCGTRTMVALTSQVFAWRRGRRRGHLDR
jgi:hypothetical protein